MVDDDGEEEGSRGCDPDVGSSSPACDLSGGGEDEASWQLAVEFWVSVYDDELAAVNMFTEGR